MELPGGSAMAYADEGSGPAVIFVHGSAGWSFEWRRQIGALTGSHRCIAPDHIGFGLSDKPQQYPYTLAQHTENLRHLLATLGVQKAHWVLSDFGGPIAAPLMLEAPGLVLSVTATNTWLWRWDHAKAGAEKQLHWANNGVMRMLNRRWNFEVDVMMRWVWGKAAPLRREIFAHYRAPFNQRKHREGLVGFLRAIATEQETYHSFWKQRELLESVPALLIWGGLDRLITLEHFACLQRFFPRHQTLFLERTGHFPQEESAEAVTGALQAFLANPSAAA
jgi:haloalkane dehalogenase